METTLAKVERLTKYLKHHRGQSEALIESIVDKLFDQERESLLRQKAELRVELDEFESHYAQVSSEFYEKFQNGEMGDNMDYFDWSATWRMYLSVLAALETLQPDF